MNEYLTPQNWTTLFKKYPSLARDMAAMNNANEIPILRRELTQPYTRPERARWITERLNSLTREY